MIKINLIPPEGGKKKVKKKSAEQTQFVVAGGSTFITVLFCVYFLWYVPNGRIAQLQVEKTNAERQLQKIKEQVKVVDNFEKNKKDLQRKNKIIKDLRKKQSGPVHILDDLSHHLPDRVWLKNFSESGGIIKLTGNALSNSEIVDYIANLKGSSYFKSVKLTESRKGKEENVPVYIFKLEIKVSI